MDMMMISSASSCTEASADHHNKHQHQGQQQEPMMGTAAVASAQREEVRSAKQARQQQQVAAGGSGERKPRPAQDHALNCPRCDSTNTKFCYYNNYSMTQPRYFCKACRRYWTQGGSLRNVPVGGGCRKNKRSSGATAVGGALPASSSSNSTPLVPGQPIMADFPNVLPTFMSNGFELPRKLPFAPLSLSSNPPPVMAPGAGSSFLDILRGGFLDGSINHQSNGFYGNGMAMPPSFGFGGVMQQHGMGEQTAAISGGATAATTQGQGQVGDDGAHQQMGSSNDMGMESGSSTSYWNNTAASIGGGVPDTQASPPPANSFFINDSSFI